MRVVYHRDMATTTTTRKPVHKGRVTDKRNFYAEHTANIIAGLKAGKVAWHKPWKATGLSDLPVSLASGKLYRGSNVMLLWFTALENGYSSNRWGSYDEMAELAGMVKHADVKTGKVRWHSPELEDGTPDPTPRGVRKGEKATFVVWARSLMVPKKDDDGKVVMDPKTGKPQMVKIFPVKFFPVYNMDQCNFPEGTRGAKLLARLAAAQPEVTPNERDEAAEALVAEYLADGPSLGHGGDSAHYVPAQDHIQMPNLADFDSTAHYLSTLYHEITHSTGHDSRLKREGIAKGTFGGFGSKVYSEEELVAEIGASLLCSIAGIDQAAVYDNSVAYLQHWISKLEQDEKLIFRAASQAQAAVDLILGTTFDKEEVEES